MKKETGSKSALKNALNYLLKKKSFYRITVVELCTLAGVNRSTFYSNYEDIYDILQDVHYDLISGIGKIVKKHWSIFRSFEEESLLEVLELIIKQMKNEKEWYILYINNPNNNQFEMNLLKYYKEKTESKDYKLVYHTIGCFAMLISWMEGGCFESCGEIAKIIYDQSKSFRQE